MKILVPTDFSELSTWASDLASRLADQPSDVHLLHLVQAPAGALMDAQGQVMEDGELDLRAYHAQYSKAQDQMAQCVRSTGYQGEVRTAKLTTGILHSAQRLGVDLIVMGTSGASGFKELLSRSEAGELALQSPVPVLSLKCDRSDLQFKNAMIIGDFDQVQKRPLDAVRQLVQENGGQWHLLAMHAKDEDQCGARQERMRNFAELNQLGAVQLHFHRQGSAELALIQLLQELELDVLCLAVQGQNLASWLMGDLALALVHHFHKPIYIYPRED